MPEGQIITLNVFVNLADDCLEIGTAEMVVHEGGIKKIISFTPKSPQEEQAETDDK